jgi:hypothetical protein
MSNDFIDQDLNYDVQINLRKFKNPNSAGVKKIFAEQMSRFFNTPEEMCDFMTQVGKNHPNGVNFRYLVQLMSHYSTSQALTNLEEKGLLTSAINEEGEVVYSLTELGKKITRNL